MRRQRGFTLLEVAVAMSVFGIFLIVAFTLTSEMRSWEKKLPVNFMRHPQIISVIARMRRDVLDVQVPPNGKIYLASHDGYSNGPKTLIIQTVLPSGLQTVVWDFTEAGVAKRISYNVGVKTQWVARGVPSDFTAGLEIDAVEFEGRPYGVRIKAKDSNGQLAIDQILQPRTHS
ncbi:MAG TPA: prepilin-type N-terminal cleavage/methylation domain-containing protein [Thermoanaerobaculia bacterium]|nr:prepilin-type N-terminal cleavage/methylation domain-containing protein [Thermoanaerobaculia bacterium]